jgi:type IV secretion system protein VirB4
MLDDGLSKREVLGSAHIPYVRHIDPQTIALKDGALLSMIEVGGLPHECAGMSDINAHHRMLNGTWLNLADERVALWSILIRRRVQTYERHSFDNRFVAGLDARYGERMNGMALYRNRLFLAVLRLPSADPLSKGAALFGKASAPSISDDDLDLHKDKVLGVSAGLASIGTRTLGFIEHNGLVYSEIATVLHWMLGGRQDAVPLTMGPIWSAAYQDRLVFGRETLEIRHPERTEYAGIFGIKEYPSTTRPTMTDELLTAPMELMAVHSFCFKAKAAARDLMTKRINQIASSRDNARKQVPLVAHAIEELADNKFCMGEHQGSVTIFADSHKALADKMAQARSYLMNGGAIAVREDMNLEAAFWAQLPGNMRYRARRGFITSRNFAALAPFHGYPGGRSHGNIWGSSVAMFRTSSGAPFHFSWHVGDLGNTFI